MELSRILLYFFTVLSLTACFPSRPLNERSTELALQAWILFEQDQQDHINNEQPNHQNDGSQLVAGHRRRITPKSVFLVPTFSPGILPPCADGYKADAMGRCLKIVKIDNTAHLDYLFKVLMQKFQPTPNETKTSDKPVSVSIPLPEEKPPEMVIVVTGSNETKDGSSSSSVDSIFAMGESDGLVDNINKQDEETTTIDYIDTTTLQEQTTIQPEENTSTTEDLTTITTTTTTTTDSSETTTFENQALFFFNSEIDSETEDTLVTTSETTSTSKTKELPKAAHLDPLFTSQSDADVKQSSNFVRFPADDEFPPSYASRFKHEDEPSFFKDDVENDDDDDDSDFESDEYRPSWSSSQLSFRFPAHYRHSGRDFHAESYYRGFPGGSDVAHLFRHRPRGRFR